MTPFRSALVFLAFSGGFGSVCRAQQWGTPKNLTPVMPIVGLFASTYNGFSAEGGLIVGKGVLPMVVAGVYGTGEIGPSAKALRIGGGFGGLLALRFGLLSVIEDRNGGAWQSGPEFTLGMLMVTGRFGFLFDEGAIPGKVVGGLGFGF